MYAKCESRRAANVPMRIPIEDRPQVFFKSTGPATPVEFAEVSDVRAISITLDDQVRRFDEFRRRFLRFTIDRSTDHAGQESRRLRVGRVPLDPLEKNLHNRMDGFLRDVGGNGSACARTSKRGCGMLDEGFSRLLALLGLGRATCHHLESDQPGDAIGQAACQIHAVARPTGTRSSHSPFVARSVQSATSRSDEHSHL